MYYFEKQMFKKKMQHN